MDRNYIIQDKYSRYLETMLSETNLAGKKFSDILSASFSEKELEGVKDYFNMLFEGNLDQSTLEDINVLQEINYESVSTGVKKVFSCEFAMIERNRKEFFALVSVYDITTEAELENRLTEEENRRQEEMRAVFELIHVEPLVFDDFLYDADNEFERINETLEDKKLSAHNALVEIYQSIHAIKSNAVILGLNTFGNKAHDLEAMIKKLREKEEVTENDMKNLAGNIANLLCEKDSFKATLDKINSFKSAGGGSENQKYYVMLELLKKTVTKVSADAGKKIKFVVDRIDNEAIDRGPGRTIKEILMQLIRNSALHGIETPEERSVCGKDETGVIWLSIKLKDEEIHVNLGDDGRGIDFDKIAKKALRLNMISKEEAKDRNVLLKAIFSPGFSTAETEGVHAGRGIGLSLVYDRVRKGKGSIKVETEAGRKTIFKITFPAGVSAK
jgi:two-component system chemotaxis sensor kinase CheA